VDDDGVTSEVFDVSPGEVNAAHVRAKIEQRPVHSPAEARRAISPGETRATLATVTEPPTVTHEADRVLDAALALPEPERTELAAILTDSIGDRSSPDEIEADWLADAKRRLAAIERGDAKLDVRRSPDATLERVTDEASRILDAAMKLSRRERACVAAILTDSIGDGSSPEEVEAYWLAEVKRRLAAVERGETTLVDFEEVMARLRAKVRRPRERILAAALQLSDAERAALAVVLKNSIGDGSSPEEVANAYRERVVAKVERSVPHAQVQAQLEARYARSPGDRRATLATVTDEADRVLPAALELPEADRAVLAAILTDSIGDGSSSEEIKLPEGTELELVIDDEGDDLGERELAALNAAISRSLDQAARGEVNPAEKILARLRERRR
jgi:putative addiction module component (TIGR02574 family)